MHAALQPAKYPVEIRRRVITYTDWQPLPNAATPTPPPTGPLAEPVALAEAGGRTDG